MTADLINFSDHPPSIIDQVVRRKSTISNYVLERRSSVVDCFDTISAADGRLEKKFNDLNKVTLTDIDKFIRKSLQHVGCDVLQGALLSLELQYSDHELTFDLIESYIKNEFNHHPDKVHFYRISPDLLKRKRAVLEFIDTCKQNRHAFVMIEQSETMTLDMALTLTGFLKGCLEDEDLATSVVMVLFCISTRIAQLNMDLVECFRDITIIKRETSSASYDAVRELLEGYAYQPKLGPDFLHLVYDSYLFCDTSLRNIHYMYKYAIFEHFIFNNASCPKGLTDHKSVAKFKKQVSGSLMHHMNLCEELYCLLDLLHEAGSFPGTVTDLYDELAKHKNLGQSVEVFNAICNISKYPREALLRRISVIEGRQPKSNTSKGFHSIVLKFKDKIENNDDCAEIVGEMKRQLQNHAQSLLNPMKDNLKRFIYYNGSSEVYDYLLPSLHGSDKFHRHLQSDSTYFGAIWNSIQNNAGSIDIRELFEDVKEKIKEIMKAETSDSDEGLAKAIFVDTLNNLRFQMFIKQNDRTIKRLFWRNLDSIDRDR